MGIHNPVTILQTYTGAIISQATMTLSATSQALSDIPGGIPSDANTVLLQLHGGTADGYISFDGTAATATDLLLNNASDKGPGTELMLTGNLNNINILGTAAAESLVCWFLG